MEPKGCFSVNDTNGPLTICVQSANNVKFRGRIYRELNPSLQEVYVEYSRHGTVIKGQEKAQVKSRYEEDVHISNHTVRFSTRAGTLIINLFTLKF